MELCLFIELPSLSRSEKQAKGTHTGLKKKIYFNNVKITSTGIHSRRCAHYNWAKGRNPAAADTSMGKRAVPPKQALLPFSQVGELAASGKCA